MGTIHVYIQNADNASQSSEPLGRGRHNVYFYNHSTLENTNRRHSAVETGHSAVETWHHCGSMRRGHSTNSLHVTIVLHTSTVWHYMSYYTTKYTGHASMLLDGQCCWMGSAAALCVNSSVPIIMVWRS